MEEGDYLIAVGSTELTSDMNPYRLFEGTVDRQVTLLVNDEPTREGAREITVVPIGDEGFGSFCDEPVPLGAIYLPERRPARQRSIKIRRPEREPSTAGFCTSKSPDRNGFI